ncbi:SMC-Scp complex subunit ScpB [Oceanipulchritudo coccoides]|nr:SMC-Scp complex subunit ScpB [Oceanipulchritudo coccoides]
MIAHCPFWNMEFDLKKTLLTLLHSTNEPLSIKDVQAVITRYHERAEQYLEDQEESADGPGQADEDGQEVMRDLLDQVPSLLTSAQIRDAMDSIADDLKESDEVFRLREGPNGYRLAVSPRYADWVRLLRDEPRPQRLSPAAMETLAIVAYRQPVTRSEIEAIRGVSADSALNKLMERELVFVIGRAELPGRPLQYGTTDGFLEFCGLKSLEELPSSDVLSPNQITEWIRSATMPEEQISDKEMGLAEVEQE